MEKNKRIQELVITLAERQNDVSELITEATMIILTDPAFKSVLKSLAEKAVAEVVMKNILRYHGRLDQTT